MTDRESIVAFMAKQPDRTTVRDLEQMVRRGDDLITAKPKATIADLLALHDLDLGALAHTVGVTGENFTTDHVDALCGAFTSDDTERFDMVVRETRSATFVAEEMARQAASLGSKVRASLSSATIKVATPRILQSADEAPCGALIKDVSDGNYTLRLVDGRGFHVRRYSGAGVDSLPVRGGGAWLWAGSIRNIRGAVEVIAEGLTEAECRHLSSLTAADALAWCEARDKACATHDAAVIDRL